MQKFIAPCPCQPRASREAGPLQLIVNVSNAEDIDRGEDLSDLDSSQIVMAR